MSDSSLVLLKLQKVNRLPQTMKVPRWKHPSESEYSIACSEDCSGSSDRSSSYFDSESSQSLTLSK